MTRWIERAVLTIVFAAVGWFYVWTARSGADEWHFGEKQRDYYNLLLDGWLDGQLAMKVEVPAALLNAKDPYDPDQRPLGVALHDASLYHGKYYMYFGVGPLVTAMLPFRLLTGVDLPQAAAVVGFAYIGFLGSAAMWLMIRRRYFSTSGVVVAALGVLALGVVGLGPVLVRRPHVWELPIASGHCFAMLALVCIFRALHSGRRSLAWFSGAGLCFGLAIASRPTYLVGLLVLLVPLTIWWKDGRRAGRWRLWPGAGWWRAAFAAGVPLAIIGGLLAWHNYARFGNPLEFGQRYQLSSMYESKLIHFSPHYVPLNARLYFWSPAQWTRYFPFIDGIKNPPTPPNYGGFEDVYGVLTNLPFVWLAALAPFALRRRSRQERRALGGVVAVVGLLFAVQAVFLLFFFGAHGRYMLDFVPALALLASIGLLVGERALASQAVGWRAVFRIGWGGALSVSLLAAAMFSVTATHIFEEKQPQRYRELARRLNRVPAFFEQLAGARFGPCELMVRLPALRPGERQALLSTGRADAIDGVFIESAGGQRVRFGFATSNGRSQLSRPVSPDPAQPHLVRIAMRSLYPPTTHAFFDGKTAAEIDRQKGRLVVELDGERLLDAPRHFHEVSAGSPRIGEAPDPDAFGARFSGKILNVRRGLVDESEWGGNDPHCVRLRIAFTKVGPQPEPLISLGEPGQGDLVFVRAAEGDRIRFGWTSSMGATVESDAIDTHGRQVHELVIRLPEAARTAASSRPQTATRPLRIDLDGTIVWAPRVAMAHAADARPVVARNTVALAGCAERLSDTIFGVDQFREGADPLVHGRGALRLTLRLPTTPPSGAEPLLVTGHAEAGDFLFVEYVSAGSVRFGLDHWGSPSIHSEVLPLDFGVPHDVELSFGAIEDRPPASSPRSGRGELRVRLDGRDVWTSETDFYWPAPGEVFIARNPVGGSSCAAEFTGEIIRAERGGKPDASAPSAQNK